MSDSIPQAMYDAATSAVLAIEHAIIKEKNVPAIFVPADDVLTAYAARLAKAALDGAMAWTDAQNPPVVAGA